MSRSIQAVLYFSELLLASLAAGLLSVDVVSFDSLFFSSLSAFFILEVSPEGDL